MIESPLVGKRGKGHNEGMNSPRNWTDVTESLTILQQDGPALSEAELANLLSIGEGLPALLEEAEDQSRDALDEVIRQRLGGAGWKEIGATWKMFLEERFEWAFAVIETMDRCGVPVPEGFCPVDLLIEGWDAAGAAHTHDDCLRRYLPELLQGAAGGRYENAGG